jgi:hypothetical protein
MVVLYSCKKEKYSMDALTTPSDVVVTAEVVGKDATHPDGDGSGDVIFTVSGNNAITYQIDYDINDAVNMVLIPANGSIRKKYTTLGINTYTVTVAAFGKGGAATTITQDVTVRSDFAPDAAIVTNLTNDASKTWVVDENVAGHFGVGPWDPTVITPVWWQAAPHEKAACCPCFYSATFTFTKVSSTNYTLTSNTPQGAFTKTGSLTTLPGIPGSGPEACYAYPGGTSSFSFVPPGSGVTPSPLGTAILLSGNETFIGYGALLKEYEIMELTPTYMYLRVQGTETGNAWYLKLIPQ